MIEVEQTLFVAKEGAYIRIKGKRIYITYEDQNLASFPLIKIRDIVIQAPVQISYRALSEILNAGINVIFFNTRGRYLGKLEPVDSSNPFVKLRQSRAAFNPTESFLIAKSIVKGKIANCKNLLMKHSRNTGNLDVYENANRLTEFIVGLEKCTTLDELRGIEGISSRIYFSGLTKLIKQSGFRTKGRSKRPPKDRFNTLLSYGYAILLKDIINSCYIAGLDPYIGYLHSYKYNRPALALDLMEEWRPVVIDSLVLSIVNKKVITEDDFETNEDIHIITPSGRKKFLEAYNTKIETKINEVLTDKTLGVLLLKFKVLLQW